MTLAEVGRAKNTKVATLPRHRQQHQPRLKHWRSKLAMSRHWISNVTTSATTLIEGLRTSSVQCRDITAPMSRHQLKRLEEKMQCRDIESTMSSHQIKAIKVGTLKDQCRDIAMTSTLNISKIKELSRHLHDIANRGKTLQRQCRNITKMSRHQNMAT